MLATPVAISIIMPVKNGGVYLQEAVESILKQTLADLELIVIDDGSTDGSREWVERLSLVDQRVRLIRNPGSGIVAALNAGIVHSQSDIIGRMDADDVSLPNRLAEQVDYLKIHPEVVALGTQAVAIDSAGNELRAMAFPASHEEIENYNWNGVGGILHPALVMRKSSLESTGVYRVEFQFAEDRDLLIRLAEIGKLANLNCVGVKYRMTATQTTSARALEVKQAVKRVLEEALQRRGLQNRQCLVPKLLDIAWCAQNAGKYQLAFSSALQALSMNWLNGSSWRTVVRTSLGPLLSWFRRE